MMIFFAATVVFDVFHDPLIQSSSSSQASQLESPQVIKKTEDWIQIKHAPNEYTQMLYNVNHQLLPGDYIVFGFSEDEIEIIGIYLGDDQVVHITPEENVTDLRMSQLSDLEATNLERFPYRAIFRPIQSEMIENLPISDSVAIPSSFSSSFEELFECCFVNEQKMPLIISPKDRNVSLAAFETWIKEHQDEFKSLLATEGALLLRNFPVESAEDFASVVRSVLGRQLMDYRGGEGSRKRVAEGVYTSTEAPPQFHIPLHHELSCSNYAPDYICFYCDIVPEPGSGQTILGRTEVITQGIQEHSDVWNFFKGRNIRYISRHPPAGSWFSRVNKTHKTWPEAFETTDREEVEKICREKGLEYKWLGDWIEVVRVVPAIRDPDEFFDKPYWFNQVHLYHANPRIRGGMLNHFLANLLYAVPSTRQYDVELEDGTPIPTEMIYKIYDVLEQQTIKFDWQRGDVLVVDNRRALHGRAPYSGQRRILASMVP